MLPYVRISVILLILCGGVYPAFVTVIGGAIFPRQAQGSIVYNKDGTAIGSALIGQAFDKDIYFHPRPSTAGTDGYDATASSGSNLGPTNQKLIDRVKGDAASLRQENPALTTLPADLLTTSGSGLDPNISPEAAMAQVPRVAAARKLSVDQVTRLVQNNTRGRDLGLFGDPRVNVLELNLALDQIAQS